MDGSLSMSTPGNHIKEGPGEGCGGDIKQEICILEIHLKT